MTISVASAMPNPGAICRSVGGIQALVKIDMCYSHWQPLLVADSFEKMTIQTPVGVLANNFNLQGATDAANHFQAVTAEEFEKY